MYLTRAIFCVKDIPIFGKAKLMDKRFRPAISSRGLVLLVAFLTYSAGTLGAEKIKFGTPLKVNPQYALPVLASEEKGSWNKEGVEVEWVPFQGGGPLFRAMAAGSVQMAHDSALSTIQAISRGVPLIIVANLGGIEDMFVWARPDSPIKEPKDLKGTRIGITRFGGLAEVYGKLIAKALGLEKDIKFVAVGGVRELSAAIRSGAVDAGLSTLFSQAPLKFSGELKEIMAARDYLPRSWPHLMVFSRREFFQSRPQEVKALVRGLFAGAAYVRKDQAWTLEKMKNFSGYSEAAARGLFPYLQYNEQGKVTTDSLESARNFLIEYGLIPRDKAPATESLFTREVTG